MRNITLAIDDDLLERARRKAAEKKTTVNAVVRESLRQFVSLDDERAQARRELGELIRRSTAELPSDWKWNREELYADRLLPRHERADLRGLTEDGADEGRSRRVDDDA